MSLLFFQAEDGIRDLVRSRGLGDVYKRQALQTLTERNQFNTEFGRSSFSILLMQDLVAIPALAIIPSLASTSAEPASWTKLLSFFSILIVLILASRYLMRPVFRILAGTHTREIFTAATSVSYTHLTLPTRDLVSISVVAGSLTKKTTKQDSAR